jgi:hypothetical protein
MQDGIGQAGDSGQAITVVQIAGNGDDAGGAKFCVALRRVAQCINFCAVIEQMSYSQADIAAANDQYSHIRFIERKTS